MSLQNSFLSDKLLKVSKLEIAHNACSSIPSEIARRQREIGWKRASNLKPVKVSKGNR